MGFKRETRRGVVVVAAVLACALASAHGARARQLPEAGARLDADGRWANGVTESWWVGEGIPIADAAAAAARWKEIGDEVARAGAGGWAGDYFRGSETHGVYMRWAPRAGFVIARVDKCGASVMGLVHGRVEAAPGLVQFFAEAEKEAINSHGHHAAAARPRAPRSVIRYVPVRWRGERLFVAEDEMEDFGDYAAGLGEYNGFMFTEHAVFFSRPGAPEGAARPGAAPSAPPAYERFLKRPVEARITSVGRRVLRRAYEIRRAYTTRMFERASLTHVTIDAGTERGVKEGMVFRVARAGEDDTVVVLRAGRRTSTAAVVRDVDDRGAETYFDPEFRPKRHSRVARGWRLTTSLFD